MNKLYYLGNAEYLKQEEKFELPHIKEKNVRNIIIDDYKPLFKQISHKSILDVYLCLFEEKGIIFANPSRTEDFFFFNLNKKTVDEILNKDVSCVALGDEEKFLVVLKEINYLEQIY